MLRDLFRNQNIFLFHNLCQAHEIVYLKTENTCKSACYVIALMIYCYYESCFFQLVLVLYSICTAFQIGSKLGGGAII